MSDGTNRTESNGPLAGYRVLDFTNFLAGPYCTRMLADLGADVIKIEPLTGDLGRHMRPFRNGESIYYAHLYAGKKSVALDLKSQQGRKAALELGRHVDVIVENWRSGIAERLGLDYQSYTRIKPDLVYCSISGYGQTGPARERPAYAPIVEALSGFGMAQMKFDHSEKPPNCGHMLGDTLASVWGFAAIQTALLHRERTGNGSHVDVAMLDAMLFAAPGECQESNVGSFVRRFYTPLKTLNGFMIVAPTSERNFQLMAHTIGHPEILQDPRFNPLATRQANWGELMRLIETWTSTRSTEECERILQADGVPCGRFRSYAEAMQDPHVVERGTFTNVRVAGGDYRMPNVPFQMPGVATHVRSLIAELGQHNTEILRDLLGYTDEQIEACGALKPVPSYP